MMGAACRPLPEPVLMLSASICLAVWCKVWPCPHGPVLVLSMWRSAWGLNAQIHRTRDMHALLRRTGLLVLGQALHEHQMARLI